MSDHEGWEAQAIDPGQAIAPATITSGRFHASTINRSGNKGTDPYHGYIDFDFTFIERE